MLVDALLTLDPGTNLTSIAAATPSANVIDLSSVRDIGVSDIPVWALWQVLPTSGTGGATINISLQTAPDNATWVTLDETGPQPLTGWTNYKQFAYRSYMALGVSRYIRMLYTPSAALTAGTIYSAIGSDFPAQISYPRNYTA